ncbi:MAG: hypothetical protein ACE5FD_11495, partial [Anaerolineae bacterium]
TFRAVRRHRGRWLPHCVAGSVVLGALVTAVLPTILLTFLLLFLSPDELNVMLNSGSFLQILLTGGGSLLWKGVFAFLAGASAYYFIKV